MLINLKVKTLDAQTHEFNEINNELSVRDFKDQIAEKTGILPDQQRIIYCGRVLADDKHLKDYDVDGKVLHVAERPPPLQRGPSASASSTSNDIPRTDRLSRHNIRNSPLFRALDGMVLGTMAIPMNGGNMNGATALHPLTASSSFCMNRITVARHMLNCVNNIAAYLEDPSRGLNNVPLDILARGRWTMESTVVEVGITATDLPQNQNIVEMVQGAVSAALRRNGNANVTVVQLPTLFSSTDGDAVGAGAGAGAGAAVELGTPSTNESSDNNVLSMGASTESEGGGGGVPDHHAAAVIIEDILQDMDDAATNASSNVAQAGSTASSDSGSSHSNSNSTSTTDGGIGSTSVGTNTDDNIQMRRTGTSVFAEVFEQFRTVYARISPFIEQTQEMLTNEPTFDENDTTGRENAQRLFDRVSEAFHYLSHAQHAISDLMLDFGQATPRFLTCRPILVEQSGYVSSNNYISAAAAAAAAANAFRQPQNPMQQQTATFANSMNQSGAPTATAPAPAAAAATTAAATLTNNNASTSSSVSGSNPSSVAISSEAAASAVASLLEMQNANQSGENNSTVIVEDPIDEPISASGPNRTNGSNTTTSNAGTQSTDNHQLQMARLIQAVVNSAPVDTEFHVQINAPSIVSFGVPIAVGGQAANPRDQRRTGTQVASGNPSGSDSGNETPTLTTASVSVNNATNSVPSIGNQARVNTATLPTTSTQTRSTSRPQIQMGTLPGSANVGGGGGRMLPPQLSAFDRFLPCSSHHIREINETLNNENAQANAASNSAGRVVPIPHNHAHPANRGTLRCISDLLRRPSLTVGSTMSAPRASAAPYSRRPAASVTATTQSSASSSPSMSASAATAITGTDDSNDSTTSLSSPWDSYTNVLRTQLNDFLNETLLEGHPVNKTNMELARNRALSWFADHLFYLRQYEKPEYDSQDSVLNVLRLMWPLFIEVLTDGQIDHETFEGRAKRMCELFVSRIYSVLIVCIGRENADLFWGQLMRLLVGPIKLRFRTEARQFLLCFMTTNIPTKTDIDDAVQFITHRRIDDDDDDDGDNKLVSNESAAEEKPTGSKSSIAPEAIDIQQFDSEMLDLESASSSEHGDFSTSRSVGSCPLSTQAALPVVDLTRINIGTEPWHNSVPNAWIPLLTRDVQFQAQNPPVQAPFSDGYISGMSAKRRKMVQASKPPTDLRNLAANSIREAIQTVTGGTIQPGGANAMGAAAADSTLNDDRAQEITVSAIVDEAAVQAACKDVVKANIRERFKNDKDYEQDRFPQSTKFADM